MEITDLNGTGEWSRARLQERYAVYRAALDLASDVLRAEEHCRGERKWIYPMLDAVVERIKLGDAACTAIGIDLVEEDQKLPFGKRLKANTAKALRHATLSETQMKRLRRRFVSMLIAGIIPREFREYSKLLRHIGVAELWPVLHVGIPRHNSYAMRFYKALCENDSTGEQSA